MDASVVNPRLTWWGHTWRMTLMLTISAVSWATLVGYQLRDAMWWFVGDLVLGIASYVVVHYRRRWPVPVAVGLNLVSCVSASSGGPAVLALVSLATRRRWREIVPVTLLSAVAGTSLAYLDPSNPESVLFNATAVLVVSVLAVGWGMYIGSRRELIATLRERADTAEREQAMRVSQARTAERARIAREMHDVLAHRISMVAMHSGALAYRTDLPAEDVRRTSALIQEGAHQALVDLREVLGILRAEDAADAAERPQPTMEDLPALVEEARTTGAHVDLDDRLAGAEVPRSLGRTAYRIVQEALTNARKHAPHTRVSVSVTGGPDDGVTVEVTNPLTLGQVASPSPPSGLGLIGLSERASLAGGTLESSATDRDFTVRAWLPWPA